jgi:hypothetical protein
VDLNSKIERIQVDVEWYQIPTWATKNKYEIRTLHEACSFEAYDPTKNVIYYPRDRDA